MGWLDDALASIAASGEGGVGMAAPQKTARERELQARIDGSAPFSLAGDASAPGMWDFFKAGAKDFGTDFGNMIGGRGGNGPSMANRQALWDASGRYPSGGDPMTAGGPVANGPGLPPPPNPLGAAGAYPTAKPQFDPSMMATPADASPFGPPPAPAPGAVPQMAAQPAIPGLNSPIGGGGAPFSIAGLPPSMAAAKQMTAPAAPNPAVQQPAIPGLVTPGSVPGVPGAPAPAVAQDDEETPAAASTDISAQRRNVPPAAAEAALVAAEPSFGDRLRSGGKGVADALREISPSLIALGQGLHNGDWSPAATLAAGRNKKAEDLATQAQQGNATARLLASKGASPQEIAAAVAGGPDVIKALVAQYVGKDKFKVVQTGENDRGRKTFQLMNEQDGTFKAIPGATVAADSPSDAAAAAGITGDNFLKTVPNAQDRSLIKQLTQYDLDPGKLSARGGNRERLLALAEQYDPDYKAALYAPRAAALKEFTSGGQTSPAAIITNGNTAIQHLGRMSELADRLGGTNKGWILNGAINWANVTIEDMKNNPDLARFKGAQDRFVEEATKFYRGVGGNKSDIDRALHILTAAQSPEARQAAIQEQAELMGSKINALQDRFKSAVGPSGWKKAMDMAGTEFPIVQQKSAEELDKIRKRAAGEKVDVPAAKAVKPGNYVYRNGALVPE